MNVDMFMCLYIAVVCMGRMWYLYGVSKAHAQVSFILVEGRAEDFGSSMS